MEKFVAYWGKLWVLIAGGAVLITYIMFFQNGKGVNLSGGHKNQPTIGSTVVTLLPSATPSQTPFEILVSTEAVIPNRTSTPTATYTLSTTPNYQVTIESQVAQTLASIQTDAANTQVAYELEQASTQTATAVFQLTIDAMVSTLGSQ